MQSWATPFKKCLVGCDLKQLICLFKKLLNIYSVLGPTLKDEQKEIDFVVMEFDI